MKLRLLVILLCCILLIIRLIIPYAAAPDSALFALYLKIMDWIAGYWQNMGWGILMLLLRYKSPYRFFWFLAGVGGGVFVFFLWGLLYWNGIRMLEVRPEVKRNVWSCFQVITIVLCLSYVVQFFLLHILEIKPESESYRIIFKIGIVRLFATYFLWAFVVYVELKKSVKMIWLWVLGGLISGPLVFYLYVLWYNVLKAFMVGETYKRMKDG